MNCNLHCSTAVQLSGAIHPWGEGFLKKGKLMATDTGGRRRGDLEQGRHAELLQVYDLFRRIE